MRRAIGRWSVPASRRICRSRPFGAPSLFASTQSKLNQSTGEDTMNFLDGALFPENQQKLVITAAPYGPEWLPRDFPEDIAVTMKDQVQKAVDCYNAGATVLHVHVREADGKGSK